MSECTVNKMYSHGLVNLEMILNATQEELGAIEGFGERLAERTYENIHNGVQNISLPILLGASSVFGFGFGTKKIESLFESIPNLLEIYKLLALLANSYFDTWHSKSHLLFSSLSSQKY